MSIDELSVLATAAIALGLALAAYALARIAPLSRPLLGPRGLQRGRALSASGVFALGEPCLRWLGAVVARLPLAPVRDHVRAALTRSGELLGLCADELLALCVLAAAAAAATAALTAPWLGLGPASLAAVTALGAAAPWLHVRAEGERRQRRIARALPAAIDLLALAMGAGLDFTGALGLLVRELPDAEDPLVQELARVLQELAMGHTRRQALAALALRAPCNAMQDFVAAVTQAEHRGNPLAEVLCIQARVLRLRRSVSAEEAAARASVLLVLPMTLLLGAILLIVLGPFIVHGFGM